MEELDPETRAGEPGLAHQRSVPVEVCDPSMPGLIRTEACPLARDTAGRYVNLFVTTCRESA